MPSGILCTPIAIACAAPAAGSASVAKQFVGGLVVLRYLALLEPVRVALRRKAGRSFTTRVQCLGLQFPDTLLISAVGASFFITY